MTSLPPLYCDPLYYDVTNPLYYDVTGATLYGVTSLVIVPGYKFAVTDMIVTNFHQPDSTLLLLVAALLGSTVRFRGRWYEVSG